MTVATHITTHRGIHLGRFSAWVQAIKAEFARRRNYHRTLRELSALSIHQLADLGLNRSMLHQAAYEAVYLETR